MALPNATALDPNLVGRVLARVLVFQQLRYIDVHEFPAENQDRPRRHLNPALWSVQRGGFDADPVSPMLGGNALCKWYITAPNGRPRSRIAGYFVGYSLTVRWRT